MTRAEDCRTSRTWSGHLLLLHDSEDERFDALTAWVREGLDRGEKVVYAEQPAPGCTGLAEALGERGLDVAAATARGQLSALPLDELYRPGSQARVVDRALDEGFPAVRLTAAAGAVLAGLSPAEYRRIEQDTDRLCLTRPVSAICQYARAGATGERLREVVADHVTGVRETLLRTGEAEGGLRLGGEVDLTNGDVLATAVATATRGETVLRLDLADLAFIDAAGCRTLVEATRPFRDGGGRVVLVSPRPIVVRALGLLGYGEVPGLEIREDG